MIDETVAIRLILDEQEAAWAAGDAAAFSSSAAVDVVFTNVMGMFAVGYAGFEAQHRHIFATFYKGSTMRQQVEHIRFVRPDVVIVNTLTEVTGFGALPPAMATHGDVLHSRLEQVMALGEEGWRVAAFHNVIVNPQAAAAAPPQS